MNNRETSGDIFMPRGFYGSVIALGSQRYVFARIACI